MTPRWCTGSLLRALVRALVLVLVLVLGFTPGAAALTPQEDFDGERLHDQQRFVGDAPHFQKGAQGNVAAAQFRLGYMTHWAQGVTQNERVSESLSKCLALARYQN